VIEQEPVIAHYYQLRQQIENMRQQLSAFITSPKYILPFLNPGRLIRVVNKEDDFGWGVVVNFRKRPNQKIVIQQLH
jgi:ATP-dependent RNA helicase DOB1